MKILKAVGINCDSLIPDKSAALTKQSMAILHPRLLTREVMSEMSLEGMVGMN